MNRICFFCGNISWSGGTERVSSEIANQLIDMGYEISFLSLYGTSQPFFELNEHIECSSLFKNKYPFKAMLPYVSLKVRRYLIENDIDIIIDVDSILSLYSIPAQFFLRTKHITWEHFNYKSNFNMFSRKLSRILAAKFSDVVVTLTKKDRDYWESAIDCNADIVPIPNPSPFSEVPLEEVVNNNIVLAVGRLTYQKGFDRLIDAWSNIESSIPGWTLVIVGDGEDEQHLKQQACKLGLRSVHFEPFSNNISEFYSKSSIYAMTSRFEGFPMVLLEASSYGLPIVSFNCDTGPDELIINGVTGKIVSDGDIKLFSKELLSLILDADLRNAMSINARREITNYNVHLIKDKWNGVLRELIVK